MLDTRLILVEGIPGAGKSTTAQWLAHELRKRSIQSEWFMDEHRDHPVIAREVVGVDEYIQRTIDNWERLVRAQKAADPVLILDGSLCSHLIHGLLPQGYPADRIADLIQAILRLAQPLNPALVFFRHRNLPETLRRIYDQRGGEWENMMVGWLESSPYAQARSLEGFAAAVQFYQDFIEILEKARQSVTLQWAVQDAALDWAQTQAEIRSFLSLPQVDELPPEPVYLRAFTGRYRDLDPGSPSPDPTCSIHLFENDLILHGFRYDRSGLIPVMVDTFEVQTLGYVLSFERDDSGSVRRFRVGGREPGVGIGDRTLLGRVYQRIGPA